MCTVVGTLGALGGKAGEGSGYENSFGTPPAWVPGVRLFLSSVSVLKELFFATWPEGLLFVKKIWTRVKILNCKERASWTAGLSSGHGARLSLPVP